MIRRWFISIAVALVALFSQATADDPVVGDFDKYLAKSFDGSAAFSFDPEDFAVSKDELAELPIGVFDSGIGGLTVLEAILTADAFDNETLKPGADGRPDFEHEHFVYLGDQANMPYGNYSKAGKANYLRELILKDATFLLGKRHRNSAGAEPTFDKPPVKAIVIACNTATAYGLEDIRAALERWEIPVFVVGVVEAGARGLLGEERDGENAIGVLATVGTCASEVYPKTIQSTLGRGGHGPAIVTQYGSADLAAIIEGEPGFENSVDEQIAIDVRALVEAHKDSRGEDDPAPLETVMLGCTHFPLVQTEIEDAFAKLENDPELGPFIAKERTYIDPAAWTARQLFQELAKNKIRTNSKTKPAIKWDTFYLSVPNPASPKAKLAPGGGLDYDYKYGRETGDFATEDTVVVPMTRAALTDSGRRLVSGQLPETWSRLPAGEPEDLAAPPFVTAKRWAIADAKTGEILWHHRGKEPSKSASITKAMCAVTVLALAEKDPGILDETIAISDAAARTGGSTADVEPGEKVTVREALYGLMLPSGNDMGNAIAEHFHPRLEPPTKTMLKRGLDNPVHATRANFLAEMNRTASELGMDDTFYRIAYGDGGATTDTTSSATDLCKLGHRAMAFPLLRKIVGTKRYLGTVTRPDGETREQIWQNTNELLGLERDYSGIKTGFTRTAGRCLLASAERDGRELIVAVLGSSSSPSRWSDTRNLFRWAWQNL